jgi:activator of 2-hydroxyglutaryl-CoA dehydratase
MALNLGLDIGAISVKLAAFGEPTDGPLLERLTTAYSGFHSLRWNQRPLVISDYRRIAGSPIQSTYDLLQQVYDIIPEDQIEGIRVTGSGSRTISRILGIYHENEFKAIATTFARFYPDVRTIFEIGGESSKYLRLDDSGGIADYDRSGECAAGTGSFLDQQALRMSHTVEQVGDLVCTAASSARIAGRCSVFAKSDMIHAQQKGYSPAEILRGLCDAVARNFKSAIVKGRRLEGRTALIGAVA